MLLDNFLWQSNEAFLRNDNLGMYFSIETRSPFLEYDLKYSYYRNLLKIYSIKKKINIIYVQHIK